MATTLKAKVRDVRLSASRRFSSFTAEVYSFGGFLLQQTGDFLLQQNGDKIILDRTDGVSTLMTKARSRDTQLTARERIDD